MNKVGQGTQVDSNIDVGIIVHSPSLQRQEEDNVDRASLLSREEALFFLGNTESRGKGVNRINEIYSESNEKGLVITFSFTNHDVGFTHIMVRGGFLRLTYDGTDSDGFPNYNESEIVFTENKDISFSAGNYWILKMLAENKENRELQ